MLQDQIYEFKQQVNELAGENLAMLRLLTDITENHEECTHDDQMYALIPLEYVSEINSHVARDVEGENPFKATDAISAHYWPQRQRWIG
ncbi:hypothetical protein J3D56_003914 [Erwinia persicina]|uniref:hypothetical protein n=1 Tax=Erwinia persicina TaxID=55211 RepID=UPI0020A1137A|nr:hypothetical protein [Erwinia persicina]MCP1440478.1 hypothetical protein [Erwinia persicina]